MELPAFVPEDLRQLARFVPTRGWDAVAWRPMLASLRQLSWRYVSGRGVTRLSRQLRAQLPDIDIAARSALVPIDRLDDNAERRAAGDQILRLYFSQWQQDGGQFIDLRSGHFHYGDGRLAFCPNGLWIQVRPSFRDGLIGLYQAFYSNDEEALDEALTSMGMLSPELGADDADHLKALLRSHFGVESGAQRFSIDTFKASFDALFEFFLAHQLTLHSDFVVLGFNLITLYLTLETLGQRHDVRNICMRALGESA